MRELPSHSHDPNSNCNCDSNPRSAIRNLHNPKLRAATVSSCLCVIAARLSGRQSISMESRGSIKADGAEIRANRRIQITLLLSQAEETFQLASGPALKCSGPIAFGEERDGRLSARNSPPPRSTFSPTPPARVHLRLRPQQLNPEEP